MDPVGEERRKCRGDLRHTRGDGHGHGQDVVGEQGRAGRLGGQLAQVVARDDVGAAAARVGMDRLFVGKGDNRQQDRDGDRDRETRSPSAAVPAAARMIRISCVA